MGADLRSADRNPATGNLRRQSRGPLFTFSEDLRWRPFQLGAVVEQHPKRQPDSWTVPVFRASGCFPEIIVADQENRDRELFNLALEQKTPAERSAYLDSACGNDPALRTRIEALLRASDEAGGFLQEGATGLTDAHDGVSEGPGSWIGRYRLLEPILKGSVTLE